MFAQTDLSTVLDNDLTAWDYGQAAIIVVVALLLARLGRLVVKRLFARTQADDFLGDLFGRIGGYLLVSVGLIYALDGLGIAIAPLLGALGIAGIAVAFALQDILENFVAGIILQLRRPFKAGDEIESGDHEGTVTAVDARTVTLRTPDGETIRLPNAGVIKNPIINHTEIGKRRTTLDVGVAYATDLTVATQVAIDATTQVSGVLADPKPEALVHEFGDSSINIAIRFWHEPSIAAHWRTRDAVARSISEAFVENGITIPFPQRVVHHR